MVILSWLPLVLSSCANHVPSISLDSGVSFPAPTSINTLPDPKRLTDVDDGKKIKLTPRSLISIAFNAHPNIASSFSRYKSEEARYDFFYTSRDSLTPRFRVSNNFNESRDDQDVSRTRDHAVELGIERLFFDTTEFNVAVGYNTNENNDEIGNYPFISADLRYPFAVSRRKLERTSEDIFRRNELDDAQLAYIQTVRDRLQSSLFRFYDVTNLTRVVKNRTSWKNDLEKLREQIIERKGPSSQSDLDRLNAELATVTSEVRNTIGRYEIQSARLLAAIGLPFNVQVEMVEEFFNPFENCSHQDLLRTSIDTDPEIATLSNSLKNAEVQLDLAERGRWDLALLLGGQSSLEGRGENESISDWSVSVGIDISAVDPRVTDSLIRQSNGLINRFKHAIAARENEIFTDTLEPLVRIDTLSDSRDQLIKNLPRYVQDYESGVVAYFNGQLNIDDLLTRRETLEQQQNEISRLILLIGANVAELCAATGKFFELLNVDKDVATDT